MMGRMLKVQGLNLMVSHLLFLAHSSRINILQYCGTVDA